MFDEKLDFVLKWDNFSLRLYNTNDFWMYIKLFTDMW